MDLIFQPAEAAIQAGDLTRLDMLVAAEPALATARSSCSHPTLLQCLVLTMPPADGLARSIKNLADHGAELTSPLIAAAGMNNVVAIAALLDLGAAIEGNGRWSPLEEGLYWGQRAAVDLLTERGAPVDSLRKAAGLGRLDYISGCFDDKGALTAAAGVVAWPWFAVSIPETTKVDPQQIIDNALIYAAAWGQIGAAETLLERGARINALPAGFDYTGTALHYAALTNQRAMVDRLLARGASPTLCDTKIGSTPAGWARHGGHEDLADYLQSLAGPVSG